MKTACGTPGYVAPEVLMHDNYSSQVRRQAWAGGVFTAVVSIPARGRLARGASSLHLAL